MIEHGMVCRVRRVAGAKECTEESRLQDEGSIGHFSAIIEWPRTIHMLP